MSIATLARRANARRTVTIERTREAAREGGQRAGAGSEEEAKATAFEQLTQYIPTETVTLFIAAVSAWTALHGHDIWLWVGPWHLIGVFTVITPLMLWLVNRTSFILRKREKKLPADATFATPWFDLIACAVAFFVWSLAVPGLFKEHDAAVLQIFAGIGAIFVSWLLSRLAILVQGV